MTRTAWLLVATVVVGIGLIVMLFRVADDDADRAQAQQVGPETVPELVPPITTAAPPAVVPEETRVPIVVPEVTRVAVVLPDVTASPVVVPEVTGSPVVITEETRVAVVVPEVTVVPDVTRVPVVVTEVTRVPVVVPDRVQPRNVAPAPIQNPLPEAAAPPVAEYTSEPVPPTTQPVIKPPAPAVSRVVITTVRAGKGHTIGPDMYQATTYGTASVVFRWESSGASGKVTGEKCMVITEVTGPGGYSHIDRSASCTGRMRGELTLSTPGTYTITTTVTGPDWIQATGSLPFEIVAG
ncbi:hypothetical protein [Hoyosella subflava]|uniref:Uncharacterized protein n=1 Tax=Hoyosella subflava (strain DSM 45089 / JCM 17490 / NBRC 109087 / DQS3-9A1) TaxID=443218 RepID=F6EJ63_HOYSD|nr:hypothetical protein [Hoyosella subflava]AEF41295.1 hypothetical protein AS9A_2848 [Hoyosella subflava DQS3-9A1]